MEYAMRGEREERGDSRHRETHSSPFVSDSRAHDPCAALHLALDIAPVALRWFPATSAFQRMFGREICRKFASDSASEEAASRAASREL
ncbi:unnamed protein product [Sphagnum troendelagicum]|uniref:Uncharacterized protein n=1 Tax=Sphagnum troendelagicum TaxID=128251 RepID=A0ABP0TTK8_9BRYO